MEALFYELQAKFYDYKPDDADALEDDEDLQGEIERLDGLNPSTEDEFKAGIKDLVAFLYEWFPDGVDEDEQAELRSLLQSAEEAIQ